MDWLAFDREAILTGELWRIWTGHLVHFSIQHAVIDIVALLCLSQIMEDSIGPWQLFLALVIGAALISIGLLYWAPQLNVYRGASGLSVMLSVMAAETLGRKFPKLRLFILVLSALLILKIGLEATGVITVSSSLPALVEVAWQAHLLGVFAGFLFLTFSQFKSTLIASLLKIHRN